MCKGVSTTIDPFWDISLALPAITDSVSLEDCLQRFTHVQDSLLTLRHQAAHPAETVVAAFHLKRFENSTRVHKKITTRVDSTEIIVMTPFITGSRDTA